ncbi:hypothetical protein V495_01306 [Pseudogymnoascus sp. VKM F-4514 (FW-929)]|nr:hypothetical protein V495_01306 [Pseudogymnoascus sp. VKM F-4514 (FW-929)]KFY59232.1 hypothetical protein V497_04456 [Pseudogymnoascus sp. VKM F-4516 (FW-969)]
MATPVRRFSSVRRSRPSYSCKSCRERRVKCDHTHPKCANCNRNNLECIYEGSALKRKDPPGDVAGSESPVKVLRHKLVVEDTQSNQGYLLIQNGGRSRYVENTFWASVDMEGLELDSLLFDLPLFPIEDSCCTADQDTGNGGSHLSCRHYIGTTEPNFSFWSSRPAVMRASAQGITDILTGLPPQDTCDHMYQNFVETVHPLIPLLHLPTFDNLYRRFWDWHKTWAIGAPPNGVLAENPSFLPILLTVLFTGSISHPLPPTIYVPLDAQRKLYAMIPVALTMVGFPHRPSLYSLMAFVLLNSMLIREEESLSSCSFVAVAFRVCQAMGIHKDGTDFALDEIQTEERRRVWCHLMHLDVMTSILSGLPLIASGEMFSDTHMIRELRDEYIGKVQSTESIDSSIIDPNYIVAAGRYDSSSCMRNILIWQFSHKPTRTKTRIERLGLPPLGELGSPSRWSNPLPPTPCGDNTEESARALWGKDLLCLMVEKAYCLLYHPIMQHSNLWIELRARAIPRFQSFLSIFINMCTTETYLPFQWLYPGAYQPLQCVAVLLIDLLKAPQSLEASKSQALLEHTFSLVGPEGRITNGTLNVASWPNQRYPSAGAKQAWMRLEKLRSKVWQKLGLDHSVLWARTIGKTTQQSGSTDTARTRSSISQTTAQQPVPSEQNALLNADFLFSTDLPNIPSTGFGAANSDNSDQQYLLQGQTSIESQLEQDIESEWQTFRSQGGLSETMPTFGDLNYLG